MSKFAIRNRWSDAAQFECELPAELTDAPHSQQMRFAVLAAIKTGSNLSGSDLSYSDLSGSNLRAARLEPIRVDIWAVLSSAPAEAVAVRDALAAGRVDGSTYSGECSCLVGTIATARKCAVESLYRDSSRPAERFFMSILPGHTPENSQYCKLAHEWVSD